jgi:hypothetical protein
MTDYQRYRISDEELNQITHTTFLNSPPLVGKLIQHLVAERLAFEECLGNYQQEIALYREEIERIKGQKDE